MTILETTMTGMKPSDYTLDIYAGRKLSLLTKCGARELSLPGANWVNQFVLTSVFTSNLPTKMRRYVFNFLRRAEGAISAYREARAALSEYVDTPRNVLSPYFRALLDFEVCISQCCQGYAFLAKAKGEKYYTPNHALYILYIDSKHMDGMIDAGRMPPEATAAIWITNEGLESNRAALSFDELGEVLLNMGRLAERFSTLRKD